MYTHSDFQGNELYRKVNAPRKKSTKLVRRSNYKVTKYGAVDKATGTFENRQKLYNCRVNSLLYFRVQSLLELFNRHKPEEYSPVINHEDNEFNSLRLILVTKETLFNNFVTNAFAKLLSETKPYSFKYYLEVKVEDVYNSLNLTDQRGVKLDYIKQVSVSIKIPTLH